MKNLPIPREAVTGLERPAPNVFGLRTVMVNLYAVRADDGRWVLIDTGMPYTASRIQSWIAQHFGSGARPSCILLTHGHFDHVGAVQELAREWNVPVYAHPLEMPYLTGRAQYPPPDPTVGGGAFSVLSVLYPKGPIDLGSRVQPIPEDGSVPGLPGWRWIHTPGHTAGHISFFRESDRVLIAGHAFVTTKQESVMAVATQRPELHGPPAYFTSDWEAASLSVARLAALIPNVVACGHGLPSEGPQITNMLEDLAAHFDDWAVPNQGRYVSEPAVTDERGIVRLPPRPSTVPIVLAFAVAAGAAWLFMERRKRA